ncbi:MAG TPA: NADH-quinone oxidoreductase subunit N [Bacteroidia bacterium]|nr:NADH-quinone oxidoreductase subunit N [Bacteroidia bacterium]
MKGLLIVSGLGILAMLAQVLNFKKLLLPLVLLGLLAALGLNALEWSNTMEIPYFNNMINFDKPALAFSGIILLVSVLWFVVAQSYFKTGEHMVDHFALVLFALVGALMLTAFKNMATLFLGIEILSVPMYVLAASKKSDVRSNEAGFKYLIMGSFASGILLFGIALVYGASGSFDLAAIRSYIQNSSDLPMFFYLGVMFILIAMCFKVAAAPFHFWAPDVYEGSPTMITALMSTVVKTAAFAAFMRLYLIGFAELVNLWAGTLSVIIALSLIVSNFTAAMQSSVKRMLAYSSISHAAFMLMVILANQRSNISIDALVYYSLAYSVGSLGAFAILFHVGQGKNDSYAVFNGLSKRNPFLAFCMAVAMLSLAGIPVTAGFFAKYFVFTTMIGTSYKWLLILAVLTSAIGAYYYLKVIIAMYFSHPEHKESINVERSHQVVITLSMVLTLILGLVPGLVAEMFRF